MHRLWVFLAFLSTFLGLTTSLPSPNPELPGFCEVLEVIIMIDNLHLLSNPESFCLAFLEITPVTRDVTSTKTTSTTVTVVYSSTVLTTTTDITSETFTFTLTSTETDTEVTTTTVSEITTSTTVYTSTSLIPASTEIVTDTITTLVPYLNLTNPLFLGL